MAQNNSSHSGKNESIVCFKNNNQCSIGISTKYNMLEYPESTMFDSKRLIGHNF